MCFFLILRWYLYEYTYPAHLSDLEEYTSKLVSSGYLKHSCLFWLVSKYPVLKWLLNCKHWYATIYGKISKYVKISHTYSKARIMWPFDLKAFLLILGYPKGHAVQWNTRQPWDMELCLHGISILFNFGKSFRKDCLCVWIFVCLFVLSWFWT